MKDNSNLSDRDFWLEQLSGHWTKTHFPYDYPVSAGTRPPLESHVFQLPGELVSLVRKLSGPSEPKLFMILAAGLSALLNRYTGEDEIMTGAPIYKQQTEGEFINTLLPLTSQFQPQTSFKELLVALRQTLMSAVSHQNYPIQRLLYELKLPVTPDDFPLFDIAVLLDNIHDIKYLDDIPFNIIFSFSAKDQELAAEVFYQPALYHLETIRQMTGHYILLMTAMLNGVEKPISQIPLMTGAEKNDILENLKGETLDFPTSETIGALFRRQAERTPDNTAIIAFKDKDTTQPLRISFRELEQRSNRLAHLLIKRGVSAGDTVGLLLEPSLELATGVLAILKTGAAYLPLDIAYPAARIDYMIRDSRIPFLLSRQQWLEDIAFDGKTISMDDPEIKAQQDSAPEYPHDSSSLAYIIYTSGSSGKPKGVCIEHRSILNYIYWRIHAYEQNAGDVSLQLAPFSFDGFCANFYPPLLSGGACVLIDEGARRDPGFLMTVIKQEKVTNFSGVPSGLKLALQEASTGDLSQMRFIVAAGEKAPASLLETCRELNENILLINEYGPTETSVTAAAYYPLTARTAGIIGKPIANNRIMILDKNLEPCPGGVWGELTVSGAGLARGYLYREKLTAEKFPANPLVPNERMYRTGDRARLRYDGNLQISGRTDQQIKHRGFRIEPGEIENALLQLETIKEAVILHNQSGGNNGDLCAYLVASEDINVGDIRNHLSLLLPEYMVPAYFVQLEKLPLTPSGKVDIRILPSLGNQKAVVFTEYVAPRNPVEEKMAALWQEELNLEQVGIHDNYFNIGGDSIKSIPLVNLVNQSFGVDLKVVDLYENDTVEKLALKVSQLQPETQDGVGDRYSQTRDRLSALKERVMEGMKSD